MDNDLKIRLARAQRTPDRRGAYRRDTLLQLLKYVQSPDASIRRLCVSNLKDFISDFPDLKEQCIDSVYDICEDPEPDVRTDGYRTIVQFSSADQSLVRRNTDVLVQLLQSDEPSELMVIKECLIRHLDLDAAATLQVMCDSCIPGPETEPEEGADRDQLRALVLSFLINDARGPVSTHVRRLDAPAERTFIDGLIRIIPHATAIQTSLVVHQLLFSLRPFSEPSELGSSLLSTLLKRVEDALEGDLRAKYEGRTLELSLPFLDICDKVVQHRSADPLPLCRLYRNRILGRLSFSKLTSETQRKILPRILKLMGSNAPLHFHNSPSSSLEQLGQLITDAGSYLLPVLLKAPVMWTETDILVSAISDRANGTSWTLPISLIEALREVEAAVQTSNGSLPSKDKMRDLLKTSLKNQDSGNAQTQSTSTTPLTFKNASQVVQGTPNDRPKPNPVKRKIGDLADLSVTSPPPQAPSLASRIGITPLTSDPATNRGPRPLKRPRASPVSETQMPSLLSRIVDTQSPQDGRLNALSNRSTTNEVKTGSYGFHIKGAAKSDIVSPSPTLQERLSQSMEIDSEDKRPLGGRRMKAMRGRRVAE